MIDVMQERQFKREAEFVRVFGYFVLLLAAALFVLFLTNLRSRMSYRGPNLSALGYIAAYAFIAGVGLVRFQKWAVVMFTLSLFAIGVVFGALAIKHSSSVYTCALAVGWAALLWWPAISALRAWRYLD